MCMLPEEIQRELEVDRSKQSVERLIRQMNSDGISVPDFFSHLSTVKGKVQWHMTWVFNHWAELRGYLSESDQKVVWAFLEETSNQSVQRDLWRVFATVDITEDLSGIIYEQGCQVFISQKYPIAVRAHAMQAAFNIAQPYPELLYELKLLMEEIKDIDSAGIRARVRNMLAFIDKKLA